MKKAFIEPDFTRSNLAISSTLAEFLHVKNDKPTLPNLAQELAKNYKNVVFICFDGLGINPIKINLDKDSLLVKNIKQVLVSTFPSTTACATTSLYQNKYPLEHGWLGWSLYHKKYNRCVDVYLNKDSETREPLSVSDLGIDKVEYFFDYAQSEYQINTIFPSFVKVTKENNNHACDNLEDFFASIKEIANKNGKQFIYAYYPDPDATMHEYGVTSKESKQIINKIDLGVSDLVKETDDTLYIISADHGQVDIKGYIEIYKDKEIMDLLKIHPYLDARSPAFICKRGKKREFARLFKQKYGKDFILFRSKDLINKGYFGPVGDKGYLLGDYIAIGTYTHKQMILNKSSVKFKGHHTSLTEEMEVPLILIGKRSNYEN